VFSSNPHGRGISMEWVLIVIFATVILVIGVIAEAAGLK
jgi:hypothetical protein